MSHRQRRTGFTLIELLIAVSIVAVLVAVAYPTYTNQVKKARRAEMQAELMRQAQFMERIFSETGCYDPGTDEGHDCDGDRGPLLSGNDTEHYAIAVTATATSFVITATPDSQSPQAGDGLLRIDDTGARAWDEDADGNIEDGENDWERG